MADEQIRFDILVEAKAAIQQLRQMSQEATSVHERVNKFSTFLVKQSRAWNVPVQQLLNTFRQLNAEMARQKTQTIFGNVGGQNIFNLAGQYLQAAQAAGRFQTNTNGVVTSLRSTSQAMQTATTSAKGFRHGIDLVRTALGTLVAVGIFQVIQAFQQMFQGMLKGLKEIEAATFNIINAERKLSKQGIEINTKGLDELIKKLMIIDPMLSKFQATELISTLTTKVAPAFGFGAKEVEQFATAITILAVRNQALGKSFEEVQQQVITGILSGKVTQGINQLGLKITDQIVKEKAVEMQLVETAKAYDALSAKEQERINVLTIMQILTEDTNQELENLPAFFKTVSGLIGTAQARFQDLLTELGEKFAPVMRVIFTGIIRILENIIKSLDENEKAWNSLVSFFTVAAGVISGFINLWVDLSLWIGRVSAQLIELFQRIPIIGKLVGRIFPEKTFPDTPTGTPEKDDKSPELQDAEELAQKVEDIRKDRDEALEDLEKKRVEKEQDIDLEYQRKAADAALDYNRKKEDIERDYLRDLQKIREKQREEDLREEEKYQLKLWELRMRFLMDLEDALHARDARQVIRLQRQYELDKELLARKQGLDDKQRAEDQRNELEDAALKRQQRLEDAKVEYEQKLADQRLAKQRELDDLNVWYKREQQDIQTNIQRKLEALIAGWVQEKKITAENAAQVYGILAKYFGPGGMTDQLYAYMASKLAVPLPPMGGGTGPLPYWQLLQNQQSAGTTGSRPGTPKMAEGGTLVATRPTTVTFGEAGAEMASFTPLSRIGKNVGKVFSSGDSAGLNGQITVSLNLSPDLEARVVENSINGVAEVVAKINRSKL